MPVHYVEQLLVGRQSLITGYGRQLSMPVYYVEQPSTLPTLN